jgi:hypothetical protein
VSTFRPTTAGKVCLIKFDDVQWLVGRFSEQIMVDFAGNLIFAAIDIPVGLCVHHHHHWLHMHLSKEKECVVSDLKGMKQRTHWQHSTQTPPP